MTPPLLILCATDLSADADLAVVSANDLAGLFGSRLVFVHAVPYPAPAQVLFPHLFQGTTSRLMAVSRLASERVAARVATLTGRAGDSIDVRVDVGAPDEVIVETAEESGADLLVIGVAGSDSDGSDLGASALRIVRHAHCPVLVVRNGPAKGPILAATDLSDPAQRALAIASLLSIREGEPLVALHVVDCSPVVVVPEAFGPGVPVPVSDEERQAIMKAARMGLSPGSTSRPTVSSKRAFPRTVSSGRPNRSRPAWSWSALRAGVACGGCCLGVWPRMSCAARPARCCSSVTLRGERENEGFQTRGGS
jgi:nucleotide-binding universal stress UspA family protein